MGIHRAVIWLGEVTMATTPTPAPSAPATPRPSRRITGTTQEAGWLRTSQSLQGERLPRNDRIVDPLLWTWVRRIAFAGGAALLLWIAYGGFLAGDHFGPTGTKVIERVIREPAPRPAPVAAPQPPADPLAGMSPAERARYEKWVLRK